MPEPLGNPHPVTWADSRLTRTGTWRAMRPVYVQHSPPCREACPAGEDIARWIDLLRAWRFREAWAILTEDNPFPATLGRICVHPCQSHCNHREFDGCIGINSMEQFLGDRALAEGWTFAPPDVERPERVAVVGGGPAGLTCAYHLRRLGYQVTLFEASDRPGGNLRHVLPDFQLPAAVWEGEIGRLLQLGVMVRTGARVGADVAWEQVRGEHAAVFIATGAPVIPGPGLPGQELAGVVDGLSFLRAVKAGRRQCPGQEAVVLGSGLTGIESARALRRLGARVTVVTAEARGSMPLPKRVETALEEGADLVEGAQVRAILGGGRVTGVELAGRVLPADLVVLATGRMTDLESLPGDAEVDQQFHLAADAFTAATAMAGVFAGGDVTGTRYAVEAVGAGKRAAAAIHASLTGKDPQEALAPARLGYSPNLSMRYYSRPESYPPQVRVKLQRVVTYDQIKTTYFAKPPRQQRPWAPMAERQASFAEVRLGISAEQAVAEARRCFNCGTCIGCDNCLVFCPDMAIKKRPDGLGFDIDWNYCKGCGACAEECPRGALALEEEVK